MKRFILRVGTIFMLSLSIVFGSALLPSSTPSPFLGSAYADPANQNNPNSQNNPSNQNTPANPETPETPTDTPADAAPGNTPSENPETPETPADETPNVCQGEAGSISWMLCPLLNASSSLVDKIYGFINDLLVIQPISTDHNSAIYKVWKKACEIANVLFAIFFLVIIYSQITGFGVNNYGIKRVLPRIIVAAIMVNLSFFISSLLVDVSNIVGSSLVDFFTKIQTDIQLTEDPFRDITWGQLFGAFTGGAALGFVAVAGMGGIGAAFWMLVIVLLGAVLSVIVGLITIGLRQGVVLVLIMASPLAFISYLLPNTEKWFEKWKTILAQMLFFYPMFSFLYGASKLAGWAIISTANKNPVFILLGFAVQVMPLFLSISMLKMSGTVLGGVSNALNRLTNPVRNTIDKYGLSQAELQRQKHLANNHVLTGARLQNYLAYRQKRREADTSDLKALAEGRNLERTYKYRSSNRGLDSGGRDTWSDRPNASTRIAKAASLQNTITAAAQLQFTNTLGEYGDVFKGHRAKALGAAHGEAYLDIMRQQFRAENIAQGDQSFLLGRYLGAAKDQFRNPYEFNRLIGGATGKLGHLGETTIMGQVIKRSSEIEERRRAESRIIMTKFGVNKGAYRGMILDKARVNDDGFEEDENGQVIEDSQYRYKKGMADKHRDWTQYIGVHKKTNAEITKEEYDALSASDRANYKKVKYMDIKDDDGDVVQRVYDDDAGYMKEMLRKDIAIGDPINRRYATEIGLKLPDSEIARLQMKYPDIDWSRVDEVNKTGKLRRYHSTIAGALQETKYAEHAGEFTAMLIAQLDNGFILNANQRNIAGLDSMIKAAKSGKLFQNDAIITKDWTRIVKSIDPNAPEGERFDDYFNDISIALSRNVNGLELKGYRPTLDEDGHLKWTEIKRNDQSMTIEDVRNWIKHKMIPDFAKKVIGAANRPLSPTVLDSLKPEGVNAFLDLINTIGELGRQNIDPNDTTPFMERFDPNNNIFENRNPREMQEAVRYWSDLVQKIQDGEVGNGGGSGSTGPKGSSGSSSSSSGSSGGSGSSSRGGSERHTDTGGTSGFNRDLRETAYDDAYTNVPYDTVVRDVEDIFRGISSDFATVCQSIRSYFQNHSPLSHSDVYNELESAIETIILDERATSTYGVIRDTTDLNHDQKLIDELYQEVVTIIDSAYSRI